MKSWKTTSAGLASLFTGLGLIAKSVNDGDYSQFGPAIAAIVGGVGLLFARDNDKTSEDVKAK